MICTPVIVDTREQVKPGEKGHFTNLKDKITTLNKKIPFIGRQMLNLHIVDFEGNGRLYEINVGGYPPTSTSLEVLVDDFEEIVLRGLKVLIRDENSYNEHIKLQNGLTQVYKELYALLTSFPEFTEVAKKLEAEVKSEPEAEPLKNENDPLNESFLDGSDFTTL